MFTPTMRLFCAAALIPMAAAAHDDGKGNIISPSFALLKEELSNVVASTANAASNAPKGFAPCIKGLAAGVYPCDNIDMLSHVSLADLGMSYVNDMWGWTDTLTGKDYALVGGAEGVTIVDISDPKRPDVVGMLPRQATVPQIIWRDLKVYKDHMYVVAEDNGSGLQVFDLTQVRGVTGDPVTFETTASYFGYDHSHNIFINEDTGFAYVIGSNTCGGGLHMVDITNPVQPLFAGCGSNVGYIHDTQCVVYDGPDAAFAGREICFNSAAQFLGVIQTPEGLRFNIVNELDIVDVTDKAAPMQLGRVDYPLDGYSHQGWLSIDQSLFFHNDELDEPGSLSGLPLPGLNSTTRIFDVSDLTNPTLIAATDNGSTAITHNAYTEGRYLYASNYTAGLRIFDTTIAADGELPEVAFFDMYPENDNNTFEGGTWSNFPYFKQKKIVAVSSQERGLFILQPRLGN